MNLNFSLVNKFMVHHNDNVWAISIGPDPMKYGTNTNASQQLPHGPPLMLLILPHGPT